MTETVDAEVKREALVLAEQEKVAVTQVKLSDASVKGRGQRRACATCDADEFSRNDSDDKLVTLALEGRQWAVEMTAMDVRDPYVGRCKAWSLCDASRGVATGELDGKTTDAAMAAGRKEATAERIEESIAARGVVEKDCDRPDKPGEAVGAASPVEMESASFERAPSADGRRPADKAEDGAGGGALGADNLGKSAGGVYNPRQSRSSTVQGAGRGPWPHLTRPDPGAAPGYGKVPGCLARDRGRGWILSVG